MITKLGEELTSEEKASLLRDGVKRRENRGEALGTALGGIGGILGGITGSVGSKLMSAHPFFAANPGNKAIGTVGAFGLPAMGMLLGHSMFRSAGKNLVNSANDSTVFADVHGRNFVPEKYKDNSNATTAAFGAASGAGIGAAGYLGAKGLYKYRTGRPLVSPVMPKSLGGAMLLGTGIGLGRQLLNKSIISGADAARDKYSI